MWYTFRQKDEKMPSDTVKITPSGETLTFNETYHSYRLGKTLCTSVTKFVDRFFAPFDAARISKETAERRGVSQQEILNEWQEIRVRGTHIHETCEDVMKERPGFRFSPSTELEEKFFECAKDTAKKVKDKLETFVPEMAMADEMYNLAGTTDLVGKLKTPKSSGETHLILDWKTNGKLSWDAFGGKTGIGPCANVPDANLWHYALQTSSYEYILKHNDYVPPDTKFVRVIVHFKYDPIEKTVGAKYYDMPDMLAFIEKMLRSDIWSRK